MAPQTPRLRILAVGGNPVSAFLTWRLQATNACDVTLVWKNNFDNVSQYGISFKSQHFGNERFRPYAVVPTPEDASRSKAPYDYVLLCVKALPDVYDLANIIESVVSPQHTCILINTTSALGVESSLEQRYPTNVVLSLVCATELGQLGQSEFEHKGEDTNIWVGPANRNPSIPATIQNDMAEALMITLNQGQVDCQVSSNIRQQQFEKMIGNIAFHPASVLFDTPNHRELLEKPGVKSMITGIIDELLLLAQAQGCAFPSDFKEKTIEEMTRPQTENSMMYQDHAAKRPLEIESYLHSPIKLAQDAGVTVPRIETIYALLHHTNIKNKMSKDQPPPPSPSAAVPPPRMSSAAGPRPPMGPPGMMNGGPVRPNMGRGSRAPSMTGGAPPGPRRGPGPPNGYPRQMNGNGYGPGPGQRRPSLEGNDLEEFSHLMLYENIPEGDYENSNGMNGANGVNGYPDDFAARERDISLREREMALQQREWALQQHQQRGGPRRPPRAPASIAGYDDDEDGDYFDPMGGRPNPAVDPDNLDMMSVTSRRTRRAPSASQLRKNPEMMAAPQTRSRNPFSRPGLNKNRTSARLMADMPNLTDQIINNPLMGYSSDRYGTVDRQAIAQESRANSLTAARLDDLQQGGGGYGAYPAMQRRTSQSPGNALSPGMRPNGRPSPPNGYPPYGGPQMNGRPSPPGMRQPVPRHPPGHGNAVAPHQVEQHAGVSNLYPPKMGPNVRSLTGSASASAKSGDSSASAHLDSTENSAHSSQSSLGPRPPLGVR